MLYRSDRDSCRPRTFSVLSRRLRLTLPIFSPTAMSLVERGLSSTIPGNQDNCGRRSDMLGTCDEKSGFSPTVRVVNNCETGTLSLVSQSKLHRISARSLILERTILRGFVFLDNGQCGFPTNMNCTAVQLILDVHNSSITPFGSFSVPVSYGFIHGCLSSKLCLHRPCLRDPLNCAAPDASLLVTFCPVSASSSSAPRRNPSTDSSATTSPTLPTHPSVSLSNLPSSRWAHLHPRAHASANDLLGAELGGSLGGAFLLLLLFIGIMRIRRHNAQRAAAESLPQPHEPFVVNPTWVLASPTSPDGTRSQLSLPDRARPRTTVVHQTSVPNLPSQYRTRVFRPRASTVGGPWVHRTASSVSVAGTTGSEKVAGSRARSHSDTVGSLPSGSDTGMWRPRVDVLGSRVRAETSAPVPPPQASFWDV
ncbi:hypothetical protein C8J57DRAFT_1357379 [Mycena rebaudengoi]|nr:hypothetical protein C8J57DRAFT_1357379 [Mycena rebaudengoi]